MMKARLAVSVYLAADLALPVTAHEPKKSYSQTSIARTVMGAIAMAKRVDPAFSECASAWFWNGRKELTDELRNRAVRELTKRMIDDTIITAMEEACGPIIDPDLGAVRKLIFR